ncbi:hypothetical protein RRG08_061977 [Elysia crispata]|uniref:Uncharacterized protein n=1 Tax=Elysia crispata TaxID=231223 RepID=A0AAE1A3H0_9GAST|nr:hypothetical protein RRG08_061977 [Elysia crispata]
MDSDSEIEDAISNVDPNESDFLSSVDEYQPSPESDSDNSDQGKELKSTRKEIETFIGLYFENGPHEGALHKSILGPEDELPTSR